MIKFIVNGGRKLNGEVSVSGSKNVALKTLVAACLTDEEIVIHNIPLISDFFVMTNILKELGAEVKVQGHTVRIQMARFNKNSIPLDYAAEVRTSAMLIAPLLLRCKKALIPNPGGCRIGARPIDRTIEGLQKMGAEISYDRSDGYFHAKTSVCLEGINYRFDKNTHTGTETLILAAVLAHGKTVLENAAEEPEIDQLISLLNFMGADVKRTSQRTIAIHGVKKLHGATFPIGLDRNEIVTFAAAALMTEGNIIIKHAKEDEISEFLKEFLKAGGGYESLDSGMRFYWKGNLKATSITTSYYPGFMTDWQGPWTVLMTKATGVSIIHETVYENRFGYVSELEKMGAHIELFNPKVENPEVFYNFNLSDDKKKFFHAARVQGSTLLHNAVVTISDLRAGATLVLAALSASGKSVIFGGEHLERGYEKFEKRLQALGADIKRVDEE